MPEAEEEKRREPRLRMSIEATFDDALKAEACVARSRTFRVRAWGDGGRVLPVGTVYAFTMKREPALTLRGQVCWVRSEEGGHYRFGVRFVDLTSEDVLRLTEFLRTKRKATTND